MACRNCVDTCNCAIVSSGTSLVITGTGAALNPYVLDPNIIESLTYTVPESLMVQTGGVRFYFSSTATITNIVAASGTAPTVTPIIVDVNKNGTTIFTTQANRPTIAVSTNVDLTSIPDITTIASGDYLTIDIDQVGSGVAGDNLVVTIEYVR